MEWVGFDIKAEPVPASRPKVTARGMAYYPARHTAYVEFLKKYLKEVPALAAKALFEVKLLFVMPRYKTSESNTHRADVDNLSKLPLDCMTKATDEDGNRRFWEDDCKIVHLTVLKRFAREGEEPHTKVRLRALEGDVDDLVDEAFHQ
ncbi:RusA family crossover junction endodeoxyribonuclease [Xinfangfangia sp. CPCC 101601]|uniref:RusA family crossover junction endodeoxyribonuclease n=1 Tax=Pseudogemmobacter lacusdianii TaxID=3069608 RepID=A0ABU0VY78_9RHOB|nr:RusA family crossover junction endodeoxyribonuclease [Xinfangfangia sp. CPCC 101601]MDQ2066714.1 RusA family crossover junction endodeoxyribonuclease [Xinfangfangia sp. CPCC 101601]